MHADHWNVLILVEFDHCLIVNSIQLINVYGMKSEVNINCKTDYCSSSTVTTRPFPSFRKISEEIAEGSRLARRFITYLRNMRNNYTRSKHFFLTFIYECNCSVVHTVLLKTQVYVLEALNHTCCWLTQHVAEAFDSQYSPAYSLFRHSRSSNDWATRWLTKIPGISTQQPLKTTCCLRKKL